MRLDPRRGTLHGQTERGACGIDDREGVNTFDMLGPVIDDDILTLQGPRVESVDTMKREDNASIHGDHISRFQVQHVVIVALLLFLPARLNADDLKTHVALGSYLTASYFDAATTAYCSGQGRCHETNPILRPIVDKHGVVAAMTVKGAMHAGIAALLIRNHAKHPKAVFWMTVGLTAAQVFVDAHNVKELKR